MTHLSRTRTATPADLAAIARTLGPTGRTLFNAMTGHAGPVGILDGPFASTPATGRLAGFGLVIVTAPPSGPETRALMDALGPAGRILIIGIEYAAYDEVKRRCREHGHLGVEHGKTLWWGAATGLRWDPEHRFGEPPLVVSYYTLDTPYEAEAQKLRASCDALGLAHHIAGVPATGQWERNCNLKADVLTEALQTYRRPVIWVDADAVIRRPLTLLTGANVDFAVHKCDGWQFASGTIYFGRTSAAEALLREWADRCRREPEVWDQVHLDHAWNEIAQRRPLHTLWLPQAYTKIFDRAWETGEEQTTVIEHFQASRRLKTEVSVKSAGPAPERDSTLPQMDVFIAGMSRSGSTMLANLLTVKSSSIVLIEPGLTRGDMGEHVRLQCERFGLAIPQTEWLADPGETPAQRFARCVSPRLRETGVRWGVKEVNPTGWLELFQVARPRRVVLIVRDLRDVAISAVEKQQRSPRPGQGEDWLFDRIASTARAQVELTRSLRPEDRHVVRYEDFVTGGAAREAVSTFLGDWHLDGAPDHGLESFGRQYEAERHGGVVTAQSAFRFRRETDPARLALADRVRTALSEYFEEFGYSAA